MRLARPVLPGAEQQHVDVRRERARARGRDRARQLDGEGLAHARLERIEQKPFGYTYLNGFGLGLAYRLDLLARRRDRDISPTGRQIYFRYDRMWNFFIEEFNFFLFSNLFCSFRHKLHQSHGFARR